MDSKFDWCIRFIRIHFQFIHRDIFEKPRRFSLGFMPILLLQIIAVGGCCYTIWSYDADTAFHAATILAGFIQANVT